MKKHLYTAIVFGTLLACLVISWRIDRREFETLFSPVAQSAPAVVAPTPMTQIEAAKMTVRVEDDHGGGSGFPVARVGHVLVMLTARHVIDNLGADFTVTTWDGRLLPRVSTAVVHPTQDLSLFLVIDDVLQPLSLADYEVGQPAMAVGYPLAQGILFSEGRIGGIGYGMQMSPPILPGMSGGPVIDRQGRAIGINKAVAHQQGIAQSLVSMMLPVADLGGWIGEATAKLLPRK